MAYTAVPTKADGDPAYTAEFINTYIRDNWLAGLPDIFTTAGDIAYASGADVAARLGIGAAGRILGKSGSLPAWIVHPTKDKVTTKGDILAGSAADSLARVGAGNKASALLADSGQAAGVVFSDSAGLAGLVTTKGDILAGSAADTAARVGVLGWHSYAVVDSTESAGVRFGNAAATILTACTTTIPATSTWTNLAGWTETTDQAGLFSSPNFVPAKTGYYLVTLLWESTAPLSNLAVGSTFAYRLYDNTTAVEVTRLCEIYYTSTDDFFTVSASGADIVLLTAGRSYTLQGYTDTSSANGRVSSANTNASFIRLAAIGV